MTIWKVICWMFQLFFFDHLPFKNLMQRIASICRRSNQFWCSSYMTRFTLSYQPLHSLWFLWFLSFVTSKYWANEESHIYRTQVQSFPACLFGALCDFIDFHGNNNLRVYLKDKTQHRSILQKLKNNRLKVKTKPRVRFLDTLKVCSVHLQEGVHRTVYSCRRVCSVHLKESVRQCAVCTCRKVHQVWNILAHDTGRHEIDREISAIIVLEAL